MTLARLRIQALASARDDSGRTVTSTARVRLVAPKRR